MRFEDMSVKLRARNAYEAIDLGYAMTLAWRRELFSIWASVYLTAALLLNLLCFAKPIVATFLMWWLKPAFDRVVLHILAGAAFGAMPTIASTWRSLPKLWWNNGLFAALTWRRLDSARSFSLPVTQLERQSGKAARVRRGALGREGRGAAVWLTIASANFEMLLVLSVYAFAELFLPGDAGAINPFRWLTEPPPDWLQFVSNSFTCLVVLLLEPFYVAGGFALYLNARTVLEGWDIELAFKRMSIRLREARTRAVNTAKWVGEARGVAKVVLGGLVAVMLSATLPTENAFAQSCRPDGSMDSGDTYSFTENVSDGILRTNSESVDTPLGDEASAALTPVTGAAERAKQVLADPMFGETRDTWRLEYVGPGSEKKKKQNLNWAWLEKFGEWLSYALRALAWGLGAAAIVALLYVLIKRLDGRSWRRQPGGPEMLFGLDVRPESLPDDICATARRALQAGETRLALSLLYRGALVALIADGRFEIARGDTEGMLVRHVAASYGGASADKPAYFALLVSTWQRVAYSHQPVPASHIEPLIENWPRHFLLPQRSETESRVVTATGAAA